MRGCVRGDVRSDVRGGRRGYVRGYVQGSVCGRFWPVREPCQLVWTAECSRTGGVCANPGSVVVTCESCARSCTGYVRGGFGQ